MSGTHAKGGLSAAPLNETKLLLAICDRRDQPLRARRVATAGLVDLDHVRAIADRANDLHSHVPAAGVGSHARSAEARRATACAFDFAIEPCHRISPPAMPVPARLSPRGA